MSSFHVLPPLARPQNAQDMAPKHQSKGAAQAVIAPLDELQEQNFDDQVTLSGDRSVNDYVYFIAGLIEQNGGDSAAFFERVEELHSTSKRIQARDEAGNEEVLAGEFSISKSAEVALSVSEDGMSMSGNFQALARGHFTHEMTSRDGSTFSVEFSFEVSVSVSIAVTQEVVEEKTDPLALDIDGDGSISLQDEVVFDIDGDGLADRTSFVSGKDVFLALDRNGDGEVGSGEELFGDHHGAANGFLELARFDSNGDGTISAEDEAFTRLHGVTLGEPGVSKRVARSYSLEELGVCSISLGYYQTSQMLSGGNEITGRGSYTARDGTSRLAADLLVVRKPISSIG